MCGARLHNPSAIHYGDAVADAAHQMDVVADEDDGQSPLFLEPQQQGDNLGLDGNVQGSGGLVGNQQVAVLGQGQGNADSLQLAPAELVGIGCQPSCRVGQLHLLQQGYGLPVGLLLGDVRLAVAEGFPEDLPHVLQGVKGAARLLKDEGNPLAPVFSQLVGGQAHQVHPLKEDGAGGMGVGGQQAGDGGGGHGLAAAGFPHNSQDFPPVHVKADSTDTVDGNAGGSPQEAEGDLEVPDGQQCVGGRLRRLGVGTSLGCCVAGGASPLGGAEEAGQFPPVEDDVVGVVEVPQHVADKVEGQGHNQQHQHGIQEPGEPHQVGQGGDVPVDEGAPAHRRVVDAQPQVGEGGLAHDEARHAEGNADNQQAGDLGDDLAENHHKGGDSLQSSVHYKFLPLDGVDHAPDGAGGARPSHQSQNHRNQHVGGAAVHLSVQQGAEEEDEVEAGNQHEEFGEPHDGPVGGPAKVARQAPQQHRQEEGDGGGHKADGQGDAAAVDNAAEQVPPQNVRSQQVDGVGGAVGGRNRAEEVDVRGNQSQKLVGAAFHKESHRMAELLAADSGVFPGGLVDDTVFPGHQSSAGELQVCRMVGVAVKGAAGGVGCHKFGENHGEIQNHQYDEGCHAQRSCLQILEELLHGTPLLLAVADSRVNNGQQNVRDDHACQHQRRDEHAVGQHQIDVLLQHCLVHEPPQSWVGKDDFQHQ